MKLVASRGDSEEGLAKVLSYIIETYHPEGILINREAWDAWAAKENLGSLLIEPVADGLLFRVLGERDTQETVALLTMPTKGSH